jgi:hypothetical protein
MSLYDDVYREALHDWLDVRRDLAADERPDRSEYEDATAFDDEDDESVATFAPQRKDAT